MNLQHLRYFLAMMETGSVSRAAALSSITQPTLSVALKRLEAEFGAQLFAPDGRGLRPLPRAKRLERHVRVAVRALSEAKRDLKEEDARTLRIGLLPSLAPGWLSAVSKVWDGRIEITEARSDELKLQVAGGRLDVALTSLVSRSGLRQQPLLREPYTLFVALTHEFAGQHSVKITDLNRQPFVLRECCEQLGAGRRLLEAAGVRIRVVAKTRQETTAASLVAAGIGITLAPRSWAEPGMRAIEVRGFPLERVVGLIWKGRDSAKAAGVVARKLEAQLMTNSMRSL
jgi:DNA-binding transcriptional LysR family regulator